jgi:hypothetical protein
MRKVAAVLLLTGAAVIAGCGSSSSSGSTSSNSGAASTSGWSAATTAPTGGVNPSTPETLPPGDIPDTVAYVPYTWPGHGLTVSIPEGWSRTNSASAVVFTDKLNTIRLAKLPASGSVTVASAQSAEVPQLAASTRGFKLQSVSTVSGPAGPAVRIAYLGYSKPDPVTGKFGVLAVERYEFAHKGTRVVLVLSAPNGSDNVDPWKKVTSSLRVTG